MHNEKGQYSVGESLIAGAVAVGLVLAALALRKAWDDDKSKQVPSSTTALPAPNLSTTSTIMPETSTTVTTKLEFIGPEVLLEEGFLVDGIALRFSNNASRGVDCQQSYQPEEAGHAPSFNEATSSLRLPSNNSLAERSRNVMFFGEETSEPRAGNNKISSGFAIESGGEDTFTIYKFQIVPSMGGLRGRAIGRPVQTVSSDELRTREQILQDDAMTFTVKIDTKTAAERLHMTIKCNDEDD